MTISSALGLLAALIGTTATLVAAWGYIRNQHPSKNELLRGTLTIMVIMIVILGMAVFISRATTITVNGQQTIPVPPVSVPGFSAPGTASPTSTTTPAPTTTPSPTVTPTTTSTPAASPTPSSSPVPSPSPTVAPSPTVPSLSPTSTAGTGK